MKNLFVAGILLATFLLSGCLHIIEEVTIRKDGSGSYRFMVDASEIKKMAGEFGNKDMDEEPQDSIAVDEVLPTDSLVARKKEHELAAERLATYQGLSNVTAIDDPSNHTTGFVFDFDNVESLQSAMLSIGSASSLGAWGESSDIEWSSKALKRDRGGDAFRDVISKALSERGGEEGRDVSGAEGLMKMMLGGLSFKQVYHFPDQKIKKCNYKGAEISKDKHTLSFVEKPFKDSEKQKAPSLLTIRLK